MGDQYDDDSFVEELGFSEDEEDLQQISLQTVSQAVVSATDWTTETILSQINKGNILLNPKFQRRDAWEPSRKSKFIESLILGLPVPQIVLAEGKEIKGSYIVVDGKQRLLTIRQFAAKKDDDEFNMLRLSRLDIRNDLRGKSLSDLSRDPLMHADLSAFENQSIRTVVIKNWPNEAFLYHVFLRLNQGSKPLSPQELRQALHPGPFIDFTDAASASSPALREILGNTKPDFRMRDVELLIRYFAFKNFLPEYKGNLKAFLDMTCKVLNDQWISLEPELMRQMDDFEAACSATVIIFGQSDAFRKYISGKYETRFNRAVFDIMMHAFSNADLRYVAASDRNRGAVKKAFEELSLSDPEFLDSIQVTTKSLESTSKRLAKWIMALNKVLDLELTVPRLIDGRIC